MHKTNLHEAEPLIALDRSQVRELAREHAHSQSLAEATVPPHAQTAEHYHRRSEELYLFLAGAGRMRLGDEEAEVRAGDCVVIPPGTPHKLWNPGTDALVLLCCCAPPYADDDTVLTGR